jgi:hypothetical protein
MKLLQKIKYELQFNNTSYYERISHKILKKKYNKLLHKRLKTLPPIELKKENAKLTLAILSNKKNFYESVAALYSFCYWKREIHIHYHEDGTLDEQDIAYLKNIFKGIDVFIRAEQNSIVKDHLLAKDLSNCAQLRDHFIFAIRSFDMIIHKKTPYLLQIDSDVLFFSKPHEILDIIETGDHNGCYNCDVVNAYTFNNEILSKYIPMPPVEKFNAGIFLHNFNDDFFAFFDNVLEHQPESVTSWHLEQTAFAMYVTYKGNFLALPKEYDLARKERDAGNKIISEHYVHNTGSDFHRDFIYKIFPSLKR